jgi:membrane-associated phospholipid phosphatase
MGAEGQIDHGQNKGKGGESNTGLGGGVMQSRLWIWVLVVGTVLAALCVPIDAWVDRVAHSRVVGGDLRRELHAIQQFGQLTSIVLVCLLMWRLDPGRAKRLIEYGKALALTGIATFGLKVLVGRARPKFADSQLFLGPWRTHDITKKIEGGSQVVNVPTYSWQVWAHDVAQLWSMPSSHTAFAVCMAVFVGRVYPQIRWMVWILAGIVAACRVLFDAHWLSDVVLGATVGAVCTMIVVRPGRVDLARSREVADARS